MGEKNDHSKDREQHKIRISIDIDEKGIVTHVALYHPQENGKNTGQTDYTLDKDNKNYSAKAHSQSLKPPHNVSSGSVAIERFSSTFTEYIMWTKKESRIELEISNEKGGYKPITYEEFCKYLEKSETLIHATGLTQHSVVNSPLNTISNKGHGTNQDQNKSIS